MQQRKVQPGRQPGMEEALLPEAAKQSQVSRSQTLKKVPSKLDAFNYAHVVFWPALCCAVFIMVLIHDLLAPRGKSDMGCPGWHKRGPDWAGSVVAWLSTNSLGEVSCPDVMSPRSTWAYLTVLPISWIIAITFSYTSRKISNSQEKILSLTQKLFDTAEVSDLFIQNVALMTPSHVCYVFSFQAIMLFIDTFFYEKTWRWVFAYQVLWWGFAAGLLQVRPTVRYCAHLSQALVDRYIVDLLACGKKTKPDWLDLAKKHRELDLDLSSIWIRVGFMPLAPSVPFAAMSVLHFLSDEDFQEGAIVATFLLVVAVIVLAFLLVPIAKVWKGCNSASAYRAQVKYVKTKKGEQALKPASHSIRAVARSMISSDDTYPLYLEYLNSHDLCAHFGIPGVMMISVTPHFVCSLLKDFVVKFPLIVSGFLAVRAKYSPS